MSMSDPIADMLTRIRNANTAKHDTVEIPASKLKKAIADILLSEGYVKAVDIVEDGKFETIKITLKYGADKNEKIITGLKQFLLRGNDGHARGVIPAVFQMREPVQQDGGRLFLTNESNDSAHMITFSF